MATSSVPLLGTALRYFCLPGVTPGWRVDVTPFLRMILPRVARNPNADRDRCLWYGARFIVFIHSFAAKNALTERFFIYRVRVISTRCSLAARISPRMNEMRLILLYLLINAEPISLFDKIHPRVTYKKKREIESERLALLGRTIENY